MVWLDSFGGGDGETEREVGGFLVTVEQQWSVFFSTLFCCPLVKGCGRYL